MLYTSPFDILNLPTAELQQLDKKMLQLKKRQLMAELQLQDNGILVLGGKELTKNDIVQLFEQLDQDDTIAMHAAIAADPALLQFLQTGKIKPGQKFNYNPLYQAPEFIELVSPFYKAAFNRYILKALAQSDFDTIDGIFGNPVLLNGADYDECFGKLHGYLDERLEGARQMKARFAADKRTALGDLHSYYIFDWVNTLNKLPEEFANFREDYAIELYNLAVDLWNGKRRDEARGLLYGLESLDCPYHIKKLITDLIKQSSKVYEASASSKSSSSSWVWIVVSVLIMLFKIGGTCNRDKGSDKYDFSSLIERTSRQHQGNQMRSGFTPFRPITKRDRAMLDFLNTLRQSNTSFTDKKPVTVALATGSNPYQALFGKAVFKGAPMPKPAPIVAPPEQKPSSDTKEGTQGPAEDLKVAEDQAISTSPSSYGADMDEKDLLPGKSFIDINNKTDKGSIVFFYSKQFVTSVYVAPNSRHTVDLPSGNYHAFCYSGSGFGKNLPLKIPNTAYTGAKIDFAGIGRFAEPDIRMLDYLLARKNLHFTAGNPNTSIVTNAVITIDFEDKDHFDMQSGKAVTAHRMMLWERVES